MNARRRQWHEPRRHTAAQLHGLLPPAPQQLTPFVSLLSAPPFFLPRSGPLERLHPAFRPVGHWGACGSAGVAGRLPALLAAAGLLLTSWEESATWEAEAAAALLVGGAAKGRPYE